MHPENRFEALFVGVQLRPMTHSEKLIVLHPVRQTSEGQMLEMSGPPDNLLRHSLRDQDTLLGGPLDDVHAVTGPPLDNLHAVQGSPPGHVHAPVGRTRHPGGKLMFKVQ